MKTRVVLPLMLAFPFLTDAVKARHDLIRTDADGLVAAPLTIANFGADDLSCNADFAHWYSAEIATVKAGQNARLELWFEPKAGMFAMLNDKREPLPLERLWCGLSGRAYATRAHIALDPAHATKGTRAISCGMERDRLVCRQALIEPRSKICR